MSPAEAPAREHSPPDLDALPPEVEDLVVRAAEVAGVPMATLNLFDDQHQHQRSTTGFAGGTSPRGEAMCSVTLELGALVHVPDARTDPRFAGSPWVDGRHGQVRFYASAPLLARCGRVLGTLCTFDVEPHHLSTAQASALQRLADELAALLEPVRG